MNKNISANLVVGQFELTNFVHLNPYQAELVRGWRNHPRIRVWMFNSQKISKKQHLHFIKELKTDLFKHYYLVKQANVYLGVVSLVNQEVSCKSAKLGIYLNPQLIGSGLGYRLAKLIIQVGFDQLNLQTVEIEVMKKNTAAISLYNQMGLSRTKATNDKTMKWVVKNEP